MPVNKTDYMPTFSEDTNRDRSANVWGRVPLSELRSDPTRGYYFYDDFTRTALLTTPTITTEVIYNNGWKAFGSAGGTLIGAFIEGGMGLVATETDDNQGIGLATLALPFKIARGKGDFACEIRLKNSVVTDTENGFVFGLWEQQTLSATVPIAAAGTLADANFVGWHRLEGDGDQLDQVYKANGVTQATVKADALAGAPTTTALVADTYIKLGMRYFDRSHHAGPYQFCWYVNGFELPDRYTVTATDGNPFPNDVQMGLCMAFLCASNNDSVLTYDWVEAAQWIP